MASSMMYRASTVVGGRRNAQVMRAKTSSLPSSSSPLRLVSPSPSSSSISSSLISNRRTSSMVCESMKALIFDCDGVILESEDLHRQAYNAAFKHFNVCINGELVIWTVEFYDMLQNKVGGGKPKMHWYFKEHRKTYATSSVHSPSSSPPSTEAEQTRLVDVLQDWKTEKYQALLTSGEVPPRPGVLRMMDEARAAGLKVAVCSAATKAACVTTVNALLGPQRFKDLDLFMAGDDVDKKKPDPMIYRVAAERLGFDPQECVVIEDSLVGLKAALGAGMRCCITYTHSTKGQEFPGAEKVVSELGEQAGTKLTVKQLMESSEVWDDRTPMASMAHSE